MTLQRQWGRARADDPGHDPDGGPDDQDQRHDGGRPEVTSRIRRPRVLGKETLVSVMSFPVRLIPPDRGRPGVLSG